MSTIEIQNIGPVEHVSIPIPENGGVVILKGRNGVGKSNTLEAVESLTTGKGKLSVRDGALRGEVSGCGATITVGRATRRTGELEVLTLEGKLSVADLVDPGLKSDDAADAKRIKALVSLTGSDADPKEFHRLLGGKEAFEAIVSPSAIDGADWVQMAERVKREIEREARKEEDHAEYADGKARGIADVSGDEELPEALPDPEGLQRQLIEAVEDLSRLKEAKEAANRAVQRRDAAAERIANSASDIAARVESLTDEKETCHAQYTSLKEQSESLQKQIDELTAKLASVVAKLDVAWHDLDATSRALSDAIDQRVDIAELQAIVNEPIPAVDDEAIANAEALVGQIKLQIEQSAIMRERVKKVAQVKEIKAKALQHRKRAAELRNAAKSTDEVLSALVAKSCELLRVEHGRLVLTTKRGTTYYSELSHGERWKLAIDVALSQLGEHGIIVLPQTAFEGLDSVARNVIAEHAKLRGVVILTAECSDNAELSAEEYGVSE
jgi:DNA repair exonuclease SbcCD ATPase subunit